MPGPKSDLPVPVSVGSALGLVAAEALPRVLEILADGHSLRANIETAVRAVEVSHGLRMQAVGELEMVLRRYLHLMPADVADAYFSAILRLLDGGHYAVPWGRLLPRR